MKMYKYCVHTRLQISIIRVLYSLRDSIQVILLFSISGVFLSCEKFVEIDLPNDQIVSAAVFEDDKGAISAMKGVYSYLASPGFADGGQSSVTYFAGISSDELIEYSASREDFYRNTLTPESINTGLWNDPYQCIYFTNVVLEGLSGSSTVTEATRRQLEGEAKFIRAFCNFYLVNMFGDIPLITSSDYRVNRAAMRNAEPEVYEQILVDLQDALSLLPADYSHAGGERARVNVWAAKALLARVHLYLQKWEEAEELASEVIDHTALYELLEINNVFLKNSQEAIWQLLSPVGYNTKEGNLFILTASPHSVSLSPTLYGAFEANDQRKVNWVGSITPVSDTYYYAFKYKLKNETDPIKEYSMVFRLAEQYLIRAEARAQQNKLVEAVADLDKIRERAGLSLITDSNPGISKTELLEAIMHERRVELFTEWGHRWFDLKRTGKASAVLGALPYKDWQSTDELYPIPQTELNNNPNLTQNAGY